MFFVSSLARHGCQHSPVQIRPLVYGVSQSDGGFPVSDPVLKLVRVRVSPACSAVLHALLHVFAPCCMSTATLPVYATDSGLAQVLNACVQPVA